MRILHLLKEVTVILIVLLVLGMNSMDKKLKTRRRRENLEPSTSLLFILLLSKFSGLLLPGLICQCFIEIKP